jgi:hypothetical protein
MYSFFDALASPAACTRDVSQEDKYQVAVCLAKELAGQRSDYVGMFAYL